MTQADTVSEELGPPVSEAHEMGEEFWMAAAHGRGVALARRTLPNTSGGSLAGT